MFLRHFFSFRLQREVKPLRLDWLSDVPQEPEAKRPRRTAMPEKVETAWEALDVIKAAGLLLSGNQAVVFDDEEEMRRVFTLLYDVFRCKSNFIEQTTQLFIRQTRLF